MFGRKEPEPQPEQDPGIEALLDLVRQAIPPEVAEEMARDLADDSVDVRVQAVTGSFFDVLSAVPPNEIIAGLVAFIGAMAAEAFVGQGCDHDHTADEVWDEAFASFLTAFTSTRDESRQHFHELCEGLAFERDVSKDLAALDTVRLADIFPPEDDS